MKLIFLIIIGIFLIGNILEIVDKKKEKRRQLDITNAALNNMRQHRYKTKGEFHCGWALVKLDDYRYAYVDRQGNYLNGELFISATEFENDTAIVGLMDRGMTIINTKGQYLISLPIKEKDDSYIKHLRGDYYILTRTISTGRDTIRDELYLIRRNGTFVSREAFSNITAKSNGNFAVIRPNGQKGELSPDGEYVMRPFRTTVDLGENLFRVRDLEYGWGIYDKSIDKIIVPCKYSGILYFKPFGTFICKPFGDGKRGFPAFVVDKNGNTIIPPKYDTISILDNKFYRVGIFIESGTRLYCCGLLNSKGVVIVQPKYREIWETNGVIIVTSHDNRCGIVKTNGLSDLEYEAYEEVDLKDLTYSSLYIADYSGLPYEEHKSCKPSFLIVKRNNLWGVIDAMGNQILPFYYLSITQVISHNIPVGYIICKNNKYGFTNLYGENILPCIYDKISHEYEIHSSFLPPIDDYEVYHQELHDFFSNVGSHLTVYQNGNSYIFNFDGTLYINQQKDETIKTIQKPNIVPDLTIHTKRDFSDKQYLLFFDTETTGIPRDYNAPSSDITNWPRLVQLSWLKTTFDGNIIEQKDYIIKPNGFEIPSQSIKIHGISNQKALTGGTELTIVMNDFLKSISDCNVLIGHNVSFDKKVVGAELIRLGYKDTIQYVKSFCTMKSTVRICKIPGMYGYKYPELQELYYFLFNKKFEDAHNSLADILATKECYFELKSRNLIEVT